MFFKQFLSFKINNFFIWAYINSKRVCHCIGCQLFTKCPVKNISYILNMQTNYQKIVWVILCRLDRLAKLSLKREGLQEYGEHFFSHHAEFVACKELHTYILHDTSKLICLQSPQANGYTTRHFKFNMSLFSTSKRRPLRRSNRHIGVHCITEKSQLLSLQLKKFQTQFDTFRIHMLWFGLC